MTTHGGIAGGGCGCGCGGDEACACAPAEFVRLRYYFGQRLGAVDFNDAQSYHSGKQRFHNLRCHGAGVLCGLRAARYVYPQGSPPATPTTVLRVTAGAALDGCGREVLVPNDQCVDVNAWFLADRNLPGLKGWDRPGSQTLRVALRYRDCPSDPSPAPRDLCGCGSGGCEFGRVRESFELSLLADDGTEVCPVASPLDLSLAADGLAGGSSERLRRRLVALTSADCPTPASDSWVCLATVKATLAGTPTQVVDLTEVDNAAPGRQTLLSTSALQALVEALAAGGSLAPGPTFGEGVFQGAGQDSGTVVLPVKLLNANPSNTPVPLANDPAFLASVVEVHVLDGSGKWKNATPSGSVGSVTFEPGPPAQFRLKWNSGLKADVGYRLTVAAPSETPVVDAQLREISPARLARTFRLVLDASTNVLTLDTPSV